MVLLASSHATAGKSIVGEWVSGKIGDNAHDFILVQGGKNFIFFSSESNELRAGVYAIEGDTIIFHDRKTEYVDTENPQETREFFLLKNDSLIFMKSEFLNSGLTFSSRENKGEAHFFVMKRVYGELNRDEREKYKEAKSGEVGFYVLKKNFPR